MLRAQTITASAICAALYAVAKAITAFVPTPWGVGQFTPGVVVPAFFAVLFGPGVAAVGAGIGVFVGDMYLSTFGLTNPLLSLIAGVPGNFVGFYVMGLLMRRWRSWRAFIWASLLGLTVGNFIAAAGVVFYISALLGSAWPLAVQLATTLGFTLFWITTMLPFVILIVPALIGAIAKTRIGAANASSWRSWNASDPRILIKDSLAVAVVFCVLFGVLVLTPYGDLLFSTVKVPLNAFWIKSLTLITAAGVLILGPMAGLLANPRQNKEPKTR